MTVEAVRAFALSWLLAHGYDDRVGAVMRYIEAESGFNLCAESRRGHFLAQWVGTRVRSLHAVAGPGCPSVEAQLAFMDMELRSVPAYRLFWSVPASQAHYVLRQTFGLGKTLKPRISR